MLPEQNGAYGGRLDSSFLYPGEPITVMRMSTHARAGREALGVDIGGVIIDRSADGTDTSFHGGNYLRTPAVHGAFSGLHRLVDERFGTEVYLVSKCGLSTERRTLEWLEDRRFYRRTGVLPGHARFCRGRREKADVCAALGITHFVDDRLEVLGYLEGVPNRFLFRPTEAEVQPFADLLPRVRRVRSWWELLAEILGG